MMGRRNEKLRRTLLTALGAVVLVAAPILVSAREALAAPERPVAEETEAPREASGAGEAKAHREKSAEKASGKSAEKASEKSADKASEKSAEKTADKKAPAKAEKSRKAQKARKKKASKDDHAAKPERRKASKKVKTKKAQTKPRRESADGEQAAPTSERGGILLNKPGVANESAPGEESAIQKASTTLKEAAQEGLAVLRASVSSKAPSAEKKATHAEKKAPSKPAAGPTKPASVSSTKEPPAAKDTGGKVASDKAKKTSKKASTRTKGSRRRDSREKNGDSGAKESSRRPCFGPAVTVDRAGLEPENFPLVDCSGEPLAEARERLSLLARPWGVSRPDLAIERRRPRGAKTQTPRRVDPLDVAPGVRRLDSGLLARLDAVARKFPGKVISLVSGYRPQSRGSLHQSARAIDLRVAGVANEELAAFCRTLQDTGCGYYPNSSFVHMDVRLPGSGSVSWIDASGPGEAPRYVTKWPPPPEPKDASPPTTAPADAAAEPPFNPPPNGDATEMGHDLGVSGKPSAKPGARDAADALDADRASGANGAKSTPLFEDPPY